MKCVSKFKFSKNQLKNLSHDILREYIIDSLNKEIDIEQDLILTGSYTDLSGHY
jgi:hypothetical protein